MSDRPKAFQTAHGMAWYPENADTMIFVSRMAELYGSALLSLHVRTKDRPEVGQLPRLQIAVSKKGRSVRVWRQSKEGEPWIELKEAAT